MSAYLGPFSRRLLEIRDRQLRRCWWCGEWGFALNDCETCAAPAERPDFMDERNDRDRTA